MTGKEKRNPKRLLSFDSFRTGSASESSSIYSESATPSSSKFSGFDSDSRTPSSSSSSLHVNGPRPIRSASPHRPLNALPPVVTHATIVGSAEPAPRAPSLRRWDNLRQHVLQPRPVTPPQLSHQSSASSSSLNTAPARPPSRTQTPKPSRFHRLAFRQAVDIAQVSMTPDSRNKIAADIEKACLAARYIEPGKYRIELPYNMGTFSTSTTFGSFAVSTPLSNTFNSNKKGEQKRPEPRRPPSVISSVPSNRATPSLKSLHQTLLHAAVPTPDGYPQLESLPHELLVLSALLTPFQVFETTPKLDEERWMALESFETIVKSWQPESELGAINRCLWCIKAAHMPLSPLRARILRDLWQLIIPETAYTIQSPLNLQMLSQWLFALAPALSEDPDGEVLNDIVSQLRQGQTGEFDTLALEEAYNALFIPSDDIQTIRDVLMVEALVKAIENSAISARRWLLRNTLQVYWPVLPSDSTLSPLLSAIHAKKLSSFLRGAATMMLPQFLDPVDAQLIAAIIDSRVIKEIGMIGSSTVADVKGNVVRTVVNFLTSNQEDLVAWAASLIVHWHQNSEWKPSLEIILKSIVTDSLWTPIFTLMSALLDALPDATRRPIIAFIMPVLNDQLVEDPPAYPCAQLTALMESVSQMYPQIFYKPLFSCAASTKELTVVNHLCVITMISRFLPDFWMRNAEMMAIALMSDAAPGKGKGVDKPKPAIWGQARLGQSILLIELIGKIQEARNAKETPDNFYTDAFKFLSALESRLWVLLDAKEQTTLVPPSQRILFLMLFREIRLLNRSLKPAPWLPRAVSWFLKYHVDEEFEFDRESSQSLAQIQALYTIAREGIRSSKRRSTMLLSPQLLGGKLGASADPVEEHVAISSLFASKELVASLTKGFVSKSLKLFVAMSTLLTTENHRKIAPLLWDQYLNDTDSSTLAASCFLIMQCAEKLPAEIISTIEVDLRSTNEETRLEAIRRISILSMSRFHIMSQHIIMDRSHRPFKLLRPPLPFVATDIGSNHFVLGEIVTEQKDGLPPELKKRLAEIGWTDSDAPVDQRQEWIHTPMSLLPSNSLDRMDASMDIPSSPSSPSSSPYKKHSAVEGPQETGLLRRKSSSGGPLSGSKRKAVFVYSLSQIFPRLAALVGDPNFGVAAWARNTIVELMRNDPSLLTRPLFDLLSGEQKDLQVAVSSLRTLFHVRQSLPPSLAHNVFNHLTGLVKHLAKHSDSEEALFDFAAVIPLLSAVTTQVSGLTIRDFRKAKIEVFLIPSGAFWFQPSAPSGPMFPRSLGSRHDPFNDIPQRLISMTIIRTSQNLMLYNNLRRYPNDVQTIRKSMSRLVLPSLSEDVEPPDLELKDFVPNLNKKRNRIDQRESKVIGLSTVLSRSYLPLVAQIFRSISRHLNDRNELAILIDGVNRILLAHGTDIGIVSQSLIALMVASTRFRRLFANAGGYTLFMPALLKVYTESEANQGIRLAIEYAINRFYSHHKESFVFQTLDVMSHILVLPGVDCQQIAKGVYTLFSSLRRAITSTTPDAAGIHNVNKEQETETLLFQTAEEKPQKFLAAMRREGVQTKASLSSDLAEHQDNGLFAIDNFVRLFLTVVAHDLTIVRAEQFMKFLRYLAPYLYNASASARAVLGDGIDALGVVLSKTSPRNRPPEAPWARPDEESYAAPNLMDNRLLEFSRKPSDTLVIQLDYLSLVLTYVHAGGQLSEASSHRVIELITVLLRESHRDVNDHIAKFLGEYAEATLLQPKSRTLKSVLAFLADIHPLITAYGLSIDFSLVFSSISQLCKSPTYYNDPHFSQFVVSQICRAALNLCESASTERLLFTLSSRKALTSLLADAILLRADVIAEVERKSPNYDFLAAILLPVICSLRTAAELGPEGLPLDAARQTFIRSAWIRLLVYVMNASQSGQAEAAAGPAKLRRRSELVADSPNQLPQLLAALQLIKVIVVRAHDELTSCLPTIWATLGSLLRALLVDGNTDFILRSQSPSPSPTHSPRSSIQFDSFINSYSIDSPAANSRAFISPRIVDYSLWSFLELICACRSPLMLQLRTMIHEKLWLVDRDLRQTPMTPSTPGGRPLSLSVFSKPRRRSGLPSPDVSPRLSPLNSSQAALDPRQTYHNIVPSMSQPNSPDSHGGLKIVHLGLVTPTSVSYGEPNGPRSIRSVAKSTSIKSLSLIRRTYFSIRAVQFFMGYRVLIPLPDGEIEEDIRSTHWTRSQAIQTVIEETKELMEEFDDWSDGLDGDTVLVSHSTVSETSH